MMRFNECAFELLINNRIFPPNLIGLYSNDNTIPITIEITTHVNGTTSNDVKGTALQSKTPQHT
jgi:hypothetical protein